MGQYYKLANDTKKQLVHLDYFIKYGPMTINEAVHYALINYMMDNLGDVMRMVYANGDAEDYADTDLLHYKFKNDGVTEEIKRKMLALKS